MLDALVLSLEGMVLQKYVLLVGMLTLLGSSSAQAVSSSTGSGDLGGGISLRFATNISADGSTVVGRSNSASNDRLPASEAAAFQERVRSAARWASAMFEDRGLTEERHHEDADDRHEREDRHDDDDDDHLDDDDSDSSDHPGERSRGPRAKLRIRSVSETGMGIEWIKLDARKSKSRKHKGRKGRPDSYHFVIREAETGRQVPGPGVSSEPVAHVRLPAGPYRIALTVRDAKGRPDTQHRRFVVDGARSDGSSLDQIEWSLDRRFRPGKVSSVYERASGIAPLGLVNALLTANTSSTLLGSGGGCGKRLNNGGNGISIVTGVISVGVTFAAPEVKVAATRASGGANSAGAGMKIAGGNQSGSCVQAQIDAINDQLKFQEGQIQDLYSIIGRDENAFFFALKQINGQVGALTQDLYSTRIDRFGSLLNEFMVEGALWESAVSGPWEDSEGEKLALDLLSIAACDWNAPACCAGAPTGISCEQDSSDGGPIAALSEMVPEMVGSDLVQITGAKLNEPGCLYDCWQNVARADETESVLLQVYKRYAEQLFDAVVICTAEDPNVRSHCPNRLQSGVDPWTPPSECVDGATGTCAENGSPPASNDVVALFDQYNDALGAVYLQSLVALNQAYSMEQLVNLYNYRRYVANQCDQGIVGVDGPSPTCVALADQGILISSIPSYNPVGGTLYQPFMSRACGAGIPITPEEHADAFNCAQNQLGLLYAQRLNFLYRHTLNYVISDAPVGSQSYPTTQIAFPDSASQAAEALRLWNLDVEGGGPGALLDYGAEIGSALPLLMQGARTPLDLLERVAGTQTNSGDSSNWTDDGVLYQAYQIGDVAACVNTLLDFNAAGNPDTSLEDVYQFYEDCPSIFALEDTTALVWGFYDGVTMQPYTFREVPGGPTTCPAACQVCADGLMVDPDAYQPGGQGLLSDVNGAPVCAGYCSGENVCGDYRFASGSSIDCTSCGSYSIPYPDPDPTPSPDWDSVDGDNGSWADSCTTSIRPGGGPGPLPEFSLVGGEPTLKATCSDPSGNSYTRPAVTCPSGRWGNDNSFLFCEDIYLTRRAAGLALSAPMGGNVRQCVAFSEEVATAVAQEGGSFSCTGEVVYGKAFANSLAPSSVMPGYGTAATLEEITSDPQHLSDYHASTIDCTNAFFGEDPAPGFYKQCFCVDGNQLTWVRPSNTASSSTSADPNNQSLLYDPLKAGLPYLSCGNYRADPNGPKVAWEYAGTGGNQHGASNDRPPTIFMDRGHQTTADDGLESDIGIRSSNRSVASGVNYEVAFTNLFQDCNTQDNIQLDIEPQTTGVVTETSSDQRGIGGISATDDDWVGPDASTAYSTATFPKIRNNDNEQSAFLSLRFEAPSVPASSYASGPSIMIDVVMQCSDNADDGDECYGQSSCMHMVTFSDANWSSATIQDRAEVMAKRGFICQSVASYRPDGDHFQSAEMDCELPDGRVYAFRLWGFKDTSSSHITNDNRAKLLISEITD